MTTIIHAIPGIREQFVKQFVEQSVEQSLKTSYSKTLRQTRLELVLLRRCLLLGWLWVFVIPFCGSIGFAEDSLTKTARDSLTIQADQTHQPNSPKIIPFRLPQTSLYFASSSYQVELSNASGQKSGLLNRGGINTYGFDLEVNSTKIMNIGAYFRAESIKLVDPHADISMRFATTLGGFVRFFYAPEFLTGKVLSSNLFTRLELGGGPLVLGQPMGIIGQTGIYVGVETYVTRWFGVSVSYGRTFEYGKETLIGDQVIWNRGEVISVALKSTYF